MERRDEFLKLKAEGLTLEAIGKQSGLSKERVRQIIKGYQPRPRPTLESKRMLSVGDAAALLGVHGNTVRRWAGKGVLKAYRMGARGDRRFRRQDIDDFLDGIKEVGG